MDLSVELTFYPFQESFIPPIKTTIEHLNSFKGVSVETFPTATILAGEYDHVMAAINDTVAWSFREFGRCVFVAKFIPGTNVLTRED